MLHAGPAAFVGAAFPQMLDLAVHEGMAGSDPVMLGRAAWAGSQRYGGGVWSGDTRSTWQDFNQQFRAGLNMVMSGIVCTLHALAPSCTPSHRTPRLPSAMHAASPCTLRLARCLLPC